MPLRRSNIECEVLSTHHFFASPILCWRSASCHGHATCSAVVSWWVEGSLADVFCFLVLVRPERRRPRNGEGRHRPSNRIPRHSSLFRDQSEEEDGIIIHGRRADDEGPAMFSVRYARARKTRANTAQRERAAQKTTRGEQVRRVWCVLG